MGTNHTRVLKVLAAGGPRIARDIAAGTGAWPGIDPHFAAVRVNAILKAEAARGHVRQSGTTRSRYHNVTAFLWDITPAGRVRLEEKPLRPGRNARVSMNAAWSSALVEHLDREARIHDWGTETSAHDRKAACISMRGLGCTLQSIADVFGVSREYIRLILRGYQVRGDTNLPIGTSGKVLREGHLVRLEDRS